MEYTASIHLLSSQFLQDYPPALYPELLHKQERPYACLLIDAQDGYLICVPFRSAINHQNAFLFTGTQRSKRTRSGLDYSKIVLIQKRSYLDSTASAIVDRDEYREMMKNLSTIVQEASDYVYAYIRHMRGTALLHPRAFARKYQFSTLPYFHDILGIQP
jgi:hypothetical protein